METKIVLNYKSGIRKLRIACGQDPTEYIVTPIIGLRTQHRTGVQQEVGEALCTLAMDTNDRLLREAIAHIEKLTATIREHDLRIVDLQTELERLTNEMDGPLESKDTRLRQLETELESQEELISRRMAESKHNEQKILDMRRKIHALQDENAFLRLHGTDECSEIPSD